MADKETVEYIRKCLSSGYSVDEIKKRLLDAGHAEIDVDDAIAEATGVKAGKHGRARHFAFGLVVKWLVVAALLGVVITMIFRENTSFTDQCDECSDVAECRSYCFKGCLALFYESGSTGPSVYSPVEARQGAPVECSCECGHWLHNMIFGQFE